MTHLDGNRIPCDHPFVDVSLIPALERFIQSLVESGRYSSASEVVREALRLLQEKEKVREWRLAELREAIGKGVADIEAGRAVDGEQAFEELLKGLDDEEAA